MLLSFSVLVDMPGKFFCMINNSRKQQNKQYWISNAKHWSNSNMVYVRKVQKEYEEIGWFLNYRNGTYYQRACIINTQSVLFFFPWPIKKAMLPRLININDTLLMDIFYFITALAPLFRWFEVPSLPQKLLLAVEKPLS